jgi:protein involved in polysaccharide export with SLBB domain
MLRVRKMHRRSAGCLLIAMVLPVFVTATYGVETGGDASAASSGLTAPGGTGVPAFEGGITSDDYVIQVDDILTIDGHQYAEFNPIRTYTVAKDGTIKLPYIKRVQAAELTKRELEDDIENRYKEYFKNLSVTVTVRSKTYVIIGEVRNPGTQSLRLKTPVMTAIGLASGFTDWANQSKVIVIRTTEGAITRHVIDCKAILQGEQEEFLIKPNDVIYVPRKGFL